MPMDPDHVGKLLVPCTVLSLSRNILGRRGTKLLRSVVEPRRALTGETTYIASSTMAADVGWLCSADYKALAHQFLIVSGLGIAAELPHLKQLIYGYNTCKTRNHKSNWCGSKRHWVSLNPNVQL
jgi:hypothetical protein